MAIKRTAKPVKRNSAAVPAENADTMQDPNRNILEQYWPDEFASPRRALFLAIASAVLAAMVFTAASVGGFTALKISLAEWFRLTTPELVSAANFDVATVVWSMTTALFLGLIHPSLGIGLLILLRPWLDGYTFFSDNVYFTWSIYFLCMIWLVRVIRQKTDIYTPPQVLIFASLMAVLFFTTRYSYQYFNTYQHLWLWLGYAILFFLTLNAARNRALWGMLLTIFLLGVGVQALFSILHFEYLLPHLRRMIQDPVMLQRYFNTTTISPEMARRFNVNRAFGSMLFPNALAAYLLIAIPFAFAAIKLWYSNAVSTMRRKKHNTEEAGALIDRTLLLAISIVLGISCFIAIFFVAHFPREYLYKESVTGLPRCLQTAPLTILAFVAACCTALSMLLLLARYGLDGFWYLFRFAGACLLAPMLLFALWITYSRGAYLGLLIAVLWSVFLLLMTPRQTRWLTAIVTNKRTAVNAVMVLFVLSAAVIFIVQAENSISYAQNNDQPSAAAPAPNVQVRQEGISLTASDLADPASLRLRFGYWKVGLRVALNHLLTGVGLGNFAIAYPKYQYIGAGDVREAHNGFLQMFAEGGFFGGILFAGFWAYFIFWGAWRIIIEQDKQEKLLLAGLYAGVVAFCIHAFVDIDFSHPSLVMFILVFAALFYARTVPAESDEAEAEQNPRRQCQNLRIPLRARRITAAALIVLLAVASLAVFRAYLQQLVLSRFNFINVSDNGELSKRMRTGQFFLAELTEYGEMLSRGEKPQQQPRIVIPLARLFLDDYEKIAANCVFYKQSPDQRNRFLRLEPGEPVPPNGLMVVARDPFWIRDSSLPGIAAYMDELKAIDRIFPYHHELALNMVKWYEMIVDRLQGGNFQSLQATWISSYLQWCDILLERNPRHADVHMFRAQALFRSAMFLKNESTNSLLNQSIDEWETVLELSPITSSHRRACALTLSAIGKYYEQNGESERALTLKTRASEINAQAEELEKKRAQAQLYQ